MGERRAMFKDPMIKDRSEWGCVECDIGTGADAQAICTQSQARQSDAEPETPLLSQFVTGQQGKVCSARLAARIEIVILEYKEC